jgi:23S rRNA (uracil1939-C5)-methyltransferase
LTIDGWRLTKKMLSTNDELSLLIEKPAAGGRMIARHEGQIVFVSGAIPGERLRVRVEQVKGGIAYAAPTLVEDASPDRREPRADPACGGNVLSHVAYPRQLELKAAIVADAFARIGKLPLEKPVSVRASPEEGYRMRARLHVRSGRIGFFREGTHDLCDVGRTGQLLPETAEVLGHVQARLAGEDVRALREVELSENMPGTERALLAELAPGTRPGEADRLPRHFDVPGVTGLVLMRPEAPQFVAGRGHPHVSDMLDLAVDGQAASVRLRRHVSAFFQGNRFLLQPLVQTVLGILPPGELLDLYAGAGLFAVSFAAIGRGHVVAVEGDRQGAEDLAANASPFGTAVRVVPSSVEAYLSRTRAARTATILVDPPRTGMSREAAGMIVSARAGRVVYVSCDVATLARDVRRLIDAGYRLTHVEAFDLFPNTAHVESLVVLEQ